MRELSADQDSISDDDVRADVSADQEALLEWYQSARRDLPWRKNRDPYRIWISEVMLQQTTVAAVIPYFERFVARFPDARSLAQASIEDVYEMWAGLGYYSRARNLHKAAQALALKFPRTWQELSEIPGFGPYTSRAVSSQAFDEKCGVVDGNVIRVLSRRFAIANDWWKPRERSELQQIADRLAQVANPSDLNQALMELGATVCTPRSPTCLICPWSNTCQARELGKITEFPKTQQRRNREVWIWRPEVITRAGRVLLIENRYAPFLRGHLIPPGTVEKKKIKPKLFTFKGTVTHHDIFVIPRAGKLKTAKGAWVGLNELKQKVPASLVRKAIQSIMESDFAHE